MIEDDISLCRMAALIFITARTIVIITTDGFYMGVVCSGADTNGRALCAVYCAAVEEYCCIFNIAGNINRVASALYDRIGQCKIRVVGNREGVQAAICGRVKCTSVTAICAEIQYYLSALGNLKTAACVNALDVIIELVALLCICFYGDNSTVGADRKITPRVNAL